MVNEEYRKLFSGKIAEGNTAEEVAVKLVSAFRLDLNNHEHAAKLAKLISANPVVIKQGLTKQAALVYQEAMAGIGAICSIQNMNKSPIKTEHKTERRKAQRRNIRDRRNTLRTSSIVPDRRKNSDRRETDLSFDD